MSGVTLSGNSEINTGTVELTETGGRALKLQAETPHLVSLGGGRLSTAVTLHPIPQGRVTLGSGPGVDIPVQGTGVEPLHCHIENSGGVVTLYPLSENLSIDGVPVACPTRLSQGVMLTIGRSNYMRFNHPAEAKLMKSVLPNSRISMTPIKFEVDNQEIIKYKKPPAIPRKSPRESLSDHSGEEAPSSILTKVSKFEYLAAQNFKKSISPKVFASNSVTVNTPAKDVLGRAPPDLQDLAKNIPQSAHNYSDSSYEKQKNKTPDRQFFGRKSPQYVNVTVNETKNINNRVVIYENGCIPKSHNAYLNINLDQQPKNELNNMNNKTVNTHVNKSVNITRGATPSPSFNRNPSPSFNRNPSPYYRIPSPVSNSNVNLDQRQCEMIGELPKGNFVVVSGSLEDIAHRKNEAEMRRNQAHTDRVKEQEIEKAEQARLEEILSMCAEYERQVQWEKNNKPTPNRIKTNGSLPRDKRQCLSPSPFNSPNHASPSPHHTKDTQIFQFDSENTHSLSRQNNPAYENVVVNHTPIDDNTTNSRYENVDVRTPDCSSPYENVHIIHQNTSTYYPQSPRTRIRTIPTPPTPNKDSSPKDTAEMIENKFAVLNAEHLLLQSKCKDIPAENQEVVQRKPSPTKFILPLEIDGNYPRNYDLQQSTATSDVSSNLNSSNNTNINGSASLKSDAAESSYRSYKGKMEVDKERLDFLKKEKHDIMAVMVNIRRKMADIKMQEEELYRELEMEKALITGEYKSKLIELEEMELRKQKLLNRAHEIELKMEDCQQTQSQHQENCKQKLQIAQEHMNKIEQKLPEVPKTSPEYNDLFEEFLTAQEVLDNERKIFEDLEFHHLEEEADWLASREEIQREILDLSQRMDMVQAQIEELEQQKIDTSTSNTQESKTLERQLIKYARRLEESRNQLKLVDNELKSVCKQESDQEGSSDSDSDKIREVKASTPKDNAHSFSFQNSYNLSCSMMEPNTKEKMDDVYNMTQSFNEKLLQEKSVLDGGIGKKFPSQDDIDRISKVTSDAPMHIDEGRGSLGKKTIESLKEIERNRQLHLVQQGSQVIEQERRRVLALKQRVQHEVRTQWAQRRQDCTSLTSTGSEDTQNSVTESDEVEPKVEVTVVENEPSQDESKLRSPSEGHESPRPLSDTSDFSVEVGGGTLGRRRRPPPDKMRPLTRYLPIRSSELDLRQHIESAGHQVVLCPHVIINSTSCRGFLHKRGSKLNGWSRRWFVFDRNKRTLTYYADKNEKKPRGGAYFQAIEEVYLDHANSVKSPNPQLTFIIKTHERCYNLMAPSPEAMRIWIDVIFTGAEGYQEFDHGT